MGELAVLDTGLAEHRQTVNCLGDETDDDQHKEPISHHPIITQHFLDHFEHLRLDSSERSRGISGPRSTEQTLQTCQSMVLSLCLTTDELIEVSDWVDRLDLHVTKVSGRSARAATGSGWDSVTRAGTRYVQNLDLISPIDTHNFSSVDVSHSFQIIPCPISRLSPIPLHLAFLFGHLLQREHIFQVIGWFEVLTLQVTLRVQLGLQL